MRRRAVLLMPSGFTIANLFFGVWAIVSASRGEFARAGLYIVLGGVCDAFDGRVARATRTGSRFGEELDSLVDASTSSRPVARRPISMDCQVPRRG
jgi:CDP-diacylglycerol--serine O-phosphatidyltransferase